MGVFVVGSIILNADRDVSQVIWFSTGASDGEIVEHKEQGNHLKCLC